MTTIPIIIGLIFLCASFVQGYTGFGFGLLALPLLAYFFDLKELVPAMALLGLIVNTIIYSRMGSARSFKPLYPVYIGAMIGAPFGAYFILAAEETWLRFALALILILYGSYSLFIKELHYDMGRYGAILMGVVAGWTGVGLSINGPPVIVYTTLQGWNADKTKAIINAYLLTSCIGVTIIHAATGATSKASLDIFTVYAIVVAVGAYAGVRLYKKTDHTKFKKVIYTLLIVAGALMIPF